MSFTGQHVADDARITVNDTAKARFTDPHALTYLNGALAELALLRPDLFIVYKAIDTVQGKVEQDVVATYPNALKLYTIDSTDAGDPIDECDKDAMQQCNPTWRGDDQDVPVNWMREPLRDPKQGSGTRFFLHPPPKASIKVMGQFAEAPAALANLAATVPVPDAYREALVHYVIYRAESMDDESVVTARAAQSMQVFIQSIGAAKQNKVVADDQGRPT